MNDDDDIDIFLIIIAEIFTITESPINAFKLQLNMISVRYPCIYLE